MWYSVVGCMVTLTLSLLAAPLTAEGQPPAKVWRIGYLYPGWFALHTRPREAFVQGLRELGWVEGHNITIEYRYTEGSYERLPALAAELVGNSRSMDLCPECASDPGSQAGDHNDPHCHGYPGRPCEGWVGHGSGAAGREYHGHRGFRPGARGQTTRSCSRRPFLASPLWRSWPIRRIPMPSTS